MVLLMGGGDGMGPLEETAAAIDAAGLNTALAIVTGRNADLKHRLENRSWQGPTKVYGFVTEMPTYMRAADVLVTKAGPGTICEALASELPVILYSYLPGQEAGNVAYLTDSGAGVWAPEPEDVVRALRHWDENPTAYQEACHATEQLARPAAARDIAALLLERVGLENGQLMGQD
jgi:1,2-diacylglycerol 3-beta-galactosyltransferase